MRGLHLLDTREGEAGERAMPEAKMVAVERLDGHYYLGAMCCSTTKICKNCFVEKPLFGNWTTFAKETKFNADPRNILI